MEQHNLNDFIKGWFIGDFKPTLLKTTDFEVGIKRYKVGDSESTHYHKIATEYTIIVEGEVEMNGTKYIRKRGTNELYDAETEELVGTVIETSDGKVKIELM